MSIEQLPRTPIPVEVFHHIDDTDAVAVSMEALRILKLYDPADEETTEAIKKSIENDYDWLCLADLTTAPEPGGELFVQLPLCSPYFSMQAMLSVIDRNKYDSGNRSGQWYQETRVDYDFWNRNEFSTEDVSRMTATGLDPQKYIAHGRMALTEGPDKREHLLYLLNQPFDEPCAKDEEVTQQESIALMRAQYEADHLDFNMAPLNLASVAMITLQRRIKGEPSPFKWGSMRLPDLGRRNVKGGAIGTIQSRNGGLKLGSTRGVSLYNGGVGFSVGNRENNPGLEHDDVA